MEHQDCMAGKMVDRLIRRGWHIAFAESCTGGLAAAALVEVPDASRVLDSANAICQPRLIRRSTIFPAMQS